MYSHVRAISSCLLTTLSVSKETVISDEQLYSHLSSEHHVCMIGSKIIRTVLVRRLHGDNNPNVYGSIFCG